MFKGNLSKIQIENKYLKPEKAQSIFIFLNLVSIDWYFQLAVLFIFHATQGFTASLFQHIPYQFEFAIATLVDMMINATWQKHALCNIP